MKVKKLRPFDLQAALNGEPVMLRDGSKAFVRHHETEQPTAINETLIGYLEGVGLWQAWSVDGKSQFDQNECEYDIVGMYPRNRIIKGFEVPSPETKALEMSEKRKVRTDFDKGKAYSVNVSNCTEDEKKKVQQAFFDAGFVWEFGGKEYRHLDAVQYSNRTGCGHITTFCMHGSTTEGCNMNPDEFFSYVYEPVQQGHPHSDLLMKYAEISKTDPEPYSHFEYYSDSLSKWIQLRSEDSLFSADYQYRLKPQVKIVHGVEVPDIGIDLSKETKRTDFYTPCTHSNRLFLGLSHHPNYNDRSQLSTLGLTYPYTEEGKQAAILHAKAMLGID